MGFHFDYRDELDNIWRGIDRDMQQQVGQTVLWYVYDSTNSVIDPIYDVGSYTAPGGRKWQAPRLLPVANAIKLEGQEVTNDRGFYVTDTLQLVFSVKAAREAGLTDIIYRPDAHDIDRVVYENKVFEVDQLRVRGVLTADYAVVGVNLLQVKPEELVNDPDFSAYIAKDDGEPQ